MSIKRQIVLNPENIVRAKELLERLIHVDQKLRPNEIALNRLTVTNKLLRQDIKLEEVEKALETLVREQIIIPIGRNRSLFMLSQRGYETIFSPRLDDPA